jgi:uncharacterized protein (DUF3084 family)
MVKEKEQEKTDEVETTENNLEVLQNEKEALIRELASRESTIARLEQELADRDSEVATQKWALDEAENTISGLNDALAKAVTDYKVQVVQSHPGVLAELVTGDTIEDVNESLKNAQALMERVRQEVEDEASRTRVPAGAPQRAPADLSALSPREKIQYAIGGER